MTKNKIGSQGENQITSNHNLQHNTHAHYRQSSELIISAVELYMFMHVERQEEHNYNTAIQYHYAHSHYQYCHNIAQCLSVLVILASSSTILCDRTSI